MPATPEQTPAHLAIVTACAVGLETVTHRTKPHQARQANPRIALHGEVATKTPESFVNVSLCYTSWVHAQYDNTTCEHEQCNDECKSRPSLLPLVALHLSLASAVALVGHHLRHATMDRYKLA